MASKVCPKAMTIRTKGICVQNVPSSQPSDSFVSSRLDGVGGGGTLMFPRTSRLIGHHTNSATTMTVVICMMRRAFVLDPGMPLILLHQKYAVTATAKNTAKASGS